MSLIFSKLEKLKLLIYNQVMHNLYTIFAKLKNICKHISANWLTDQET